MASENTHKAALKAAKYVEPTFNKLEVLSGAELVRALNFYNLEPAENKRKWAIKWAEKNRPDAVKKIRGAKDACFNTPAALIRMMDRGAILSDTHITVVDNWLDTLAPRYVPTFVPKATVPKVKVDVNFAAFDDAMDTLGEFEIDASKPVIAIKEFCERELENHKIDPGSMDRRLVAWLKKVHARVSKVNVVVAAKKPAKKAAAPKQKGLQDVRWAVSDPDTGVRGLPPEKVVGAKKVYVYDPKYRCLIKMVSDTGIGFEGINMTGINIEKSGWVTLRKPKEQIATGVRALDKLYGSLKESKSGISVRTQPRFVFLGASS